MRDVISAPAPGLDLCRENGHHQSPTIRAGGLIFCSGMLAVNPETGEREHGTVTSEADRMAAAAHGTPLRLGTRSRHGRRAPRGAPLHGGGSGKSVARCHRTVLAYWKFECISLQERVGRTFGS